MRASRHAGAKHAFKHVRRQHDVSALAGDVEEVTAQGAHEQVKQEDNGDADAEYPECFNGLVGDHPVVHVHDEQRGGECKQVDEQRRQSHFCVERPGFCHRVAEPVSGSGQHCIRCAFVKTVLILDKDHVAAVDFRQRAERQFL